MSAHVVAQLFYKTIRYLYDQYGPVSRTLDYFSKIFLESPFVILVSLAAVISRVNLCGLTETIDNTILIFQLIEYKKLKLKSLILQTKHQIRIVQIGFETDRQTVRRILFSMFTSFPLVLVSQYFGNNGRKMKSSAVQV